MNRNHLPLLLLFLLLFAACGQRQQLKGFNNVLTGDDSLSIEFSKADTIYYHSDALDLDIAYPDYLRHQYLEDDQMEVFMTDDVSLSFMVQDLDETEIFRTPGQTLMGMGAELLDAGDDYSIHQGHEGELEYYGKVIDDSTRMVTVILRYGMNHTEAVDFLRDYVSNYTIKKKQ